MRKTTLLQMLFFSLLLPVTAWAVEPPFIVEEQEQEFIDKEKSAVDLPAGESLSTAKQVATVRVEKVQFQGGTVFPLEELAQMVQPLIGQAVTKAEIVAVLRLITASYKNAGYALSFAFLPKQDTASGLQPLYKLARQGKEVERKARRITIYGIELLDCSQDSFTLSVRCSKGTYIRTLVEDISHKLGTGGHVTMLRRTRVAGYALSDAVSLEQLAESRETGQLDALDEQLEAAENALPDWPVINLDESASRTLSYGQSIQVEQDYERANVRLFDQNEKFMGLGEMS